MSNTEEKKIECCVGLPPAAMQIVALLRHSLFGGPMPVALPADGEGWQRLFDESRRQAVTALVYDALLALPKELRPPHGILFHFTSMVSTIADDNRRREQALHRFAALVEQRLSLSACVVKGSALAALYPEPLHRECGDNDLYTGTDTARIVALMRDSGIAVDEKDPRHASFTLDGVSFECHNYLLYHNDDIDWHFTDADGYKVLVLEEEAFFLAKHMEHHAVFFHNPVRLRSLADWAMLLRADGFDLSRLRAIKADSDVAVFAELLTKACNDLFALQLPCDEQLLARKGLSTDDFVALYMLCPERSPSAAVRVVRRSWKYLRYHRQYKAIYGQSMFGRFYLKNVWQAIKQKI